MTWVKTSDDFPEECWNLSDAAYRLHHEGLSWNNQKLLDGRISKDDVRRFAKQPDAVQELLDTGFWQDGGDAWLIVHHLEYQPTREQTVAYRAAQSANGKRGGRPRKNPLANPTAKPMAKPEPNPIVKPEGRDGTGPPSLPSSSTPSVLQPQGRWQPTDADLDTIARETRGDRAHARRAVALVESRARSPIRSLKFVMTALREDPDDFRAPRRNPTKDTRCPVRGHEGYHADHCVGCLIDARLTPPPGAAPEPAPPPEDRRLPNGD
jgi:hypothetical protein